jgi:hypothetical protein
LCALEVGPRRFLGKRAAFATACTTSYRYDLVMSRNVSKVLPTHMPRGAKTIIAASIIAAINEFRAVFAVAPEVSTILRLV